MADESATINKSVAKATDAAPSLGEKPLFVLSAGARQYPGFTKGQAKRMDEQTNEFEAGLTDLSDNSKLIVAKNSAHYIQFDRPGLVVDAIRQDVGAVMRPSLIEKRLPPWWPPIHPSAWKGQSTNFAYTEFYEVGLACPSG